ncbi:MAG TPA: DUF2339 domain-containing protein [Epsilonproteobacteria bacterium]|nr:DUF2339 domain-containing protein [Campylobacterota bacterium]
MQKDIYMLKRVKYGTENQTQNKGEHETSDDVQSVTPNVSKELESQLELLSRTQDTMSSQQIRASQDKMVVVAKEKSKGQVKQHNPPKIQTPSFDIFDVIKNFFTQGNVPVKIGGIVFFFGLVFLANYAIEHNIINIQMRLAGIAIVGAALLMLGWKFRAKEGSYGLILQGLGIATLYLVVFAAAKIYLLVDLKVAFGVMLLIVIMGAFLSVHQNSLVLALFAIIGGFLVPILTSSSTGSHIALFSYYALLDLGIVIIAWYRSWRVLNLIGFIFTFGIATIWGVLRYDPAFFATTEPFLILFFIFFLVISILFTWRKPFQIDSYMDSTLVFGLPLVAFSLQSSLVEHFEYGIAMSAVAVGVIYLLLSRFLFGVEKMRLLAESFLAIGVLFLTIAIPYTLDKDISVVLLTLEASAIIWASLKQNREYAKYFALFLQTGATLAFLMISHEKIFIVPFVNILFFEYLLVMSSLFLTAYLLWKKGTNRSDQEISFVFLLLGFLVWIIAGATQSEQLVNYKMGNGLLIYIAVGALFFSFIGKKLMWQKLIALLQLYVLAGILAMFTMILIYTSKHPFADIGYVALPLFFVVGYYLLYIFDEEWSASSLIHIVQLWMVAVLGALEIEYLFGLLPKTDIATLKIQSYIGFSVIPLILSFVFLLLKSFPQRFKKYQEIYRFMGVGGILVVLLFWEIGSFFIKDFISVSFYLPLFNPLDVIQSVGIIAIGLWIYKNKILLEENLRWIAGGFALLFVVFISIIFARSMSYYQNVPYEFDMLYHNFYFQAGISIVWSILAMSVMFLSKYIKNRLLWLSGMALLVFVVLKLFFVELSNSGTLERVVSFLVVGALMLLIGYVAPIPPKNKVTTDDKGN